jgi:hypothetical protein
MIVSTLSREEQDLLAEFERRLEDSKKKLSGAQMNQLRTDTEERPLKSVSDRSNSPIPSTKIRKLLKDYSAVNMPRVELNPLRSEKSARSGRSRSTSRSKTTENAPPIDKKSSRKRLVVNNITQPPRDSLRNVDSFYSLQIDEYLDHQRHTTTATTKYSPPGTRNPSAIISSKAPLTNYMLALHEAQEKRPGRLRLLDFRDLEEDYYQRTLQSPSYEQRYSGLSHGKHVSFGRLEGSGLDPIAYPRPPAAKSN